MTATLTKPTMQQLRQTEADIRAAYKMPAVCLGQIVLWLPDPENPHDGCPALVERLAPQMLSLRIFHRDRALPELRDGVRHRSDPDLQKVHLRDWGAWDYTEETRRQQQMQDDIDQLMAQQTLPKTKEAK